MSDSANEPPLVTRPEPEVPPAPAPRRPRPGFWEAVLWCVVFMVGQLFGAVVGMSVAFTAYAIGKPEPAQFMLDQMDRFAKATDQKTQGERPPMPYELGQSLAWGMLAAQFFSLGMIAVVLPRRIGPDWKRQLGVRRPRGLHVLLVILVAPGFMIGAEAIQTAFAWATGLQTPSSESTLIELFRNFPWPLTSLAVALGPGVVEEFWCRGFVGRGLSARYGLVVGVFFTSILFALMHLNPVQILVYTLMGAYLHFVYIATRSIWPSILLHALNNGAAVLLALTLTPEQQRQTLPLAATMFAFALVLFASMALWTSRAKLHGETPDWQPEYPGVSGPPPGANVGLGYATVSPAALLLTVISFGVLVYLVSSYLF